MSNLVSILFEVGTVFWVVTQCSLVPIYETTRRNTTEHRILSLHSYFFLVFLDLFHYLWTRYSDLKFSRRWKFTLWSYGLWHRVDRRVQRFRINIGYCFYPQVRHKIEELCSSETRTPHNTTQCYNPEGYSMKDAYYITSVCFLL
jgi:hypothetical protein